ncbi:hypothetical protein FH972_024086 [Carpinus fangiana]|uniref:C2H2-type domain-containing protein n=1 Tax=Carpinus fangiana TaxID=176857 RepID=A0A5N6KX00_9ROSI|nr:hypothetical protein FH972_024086 [Carpinus fangiana]
MLTYDSDDSRRSPGLERISFRWSPVQSQHHLQSGAEESFPDCGERYRPSKADFVLLSVLAPNLPEIAEYACQNSLISNDDTITDSRCSTPPPVHAQVDDLEKQLPSVNGQCQVLDQRSPTRGSAQITSPRFPGFSGATHLTPDSATDVCHRLNTTTPQYCADAGKVSEYRTQLTLSPIKEFKCEYEGCTASHFTSRFELNSHRYVHTENRPYFCPLTTCPRSKGGKGFKRENELTRHSLVHSSPGYVCPYCPNKKYPRPDNLLRHVGTHHKEIQKDDPRLKDNLKRGRRSGNGRQRR